MPTQTMESTEAVERLFLNKPERLTAEEFSRVMTHPVVGWEICKRLRTISIDLKHLWVTRRRWRSL